jgi:acylphosphatase
MAVRMRLIVHGRVHGVGFRASVWRAAQSRGVAGWVRNRPDGTVEVVLEGEPEGVDSVVAYCREGPRAASVSRIETFPEPAEGLRAFTVR